MPQRYLHAVQLPAGPRLLEMLRAALDGTGPAVLPLAPDASPARVHMLLRAMRPAFLTTAEETSALRDGAPVADGTAVVIATSGSTGEPKGVELSVTALTHSARSALAHLGARPGGRWLACLPPDHVAGIQVLVRSIVADSEPIFLPPGPAGTAGFDVEAVLGSGADYVALVPTMLGRLLQVEAGLSTFHAILLGGSAVSPDLLRRARSAGGNVITTYGMTETCGGCVYDGVPLTGVHADLAEDGRIRLAGRTLFSGYRLSPELTAAAMDGSWLVTQDLGEWVHGRLYCRGRADDVVVTGGHNVVPAEVTALLAEYPGIVDVVVVGRPDPEWGERLVAVVVPADSGAPPTLDEVRDYVRRRAPAYCAPHALELVDTMPRLASGKPDLSTLRRGFG